MFKLNKKIKMLQIPDRADDMVFDYIESCNLIEKSKYDIPFRKLNYKDEKISGIFREDDFIAPIYHSTSLVRLVHEYNVGNKPLGRMNLIEVKNYLFNDFEEILKMLDSLKENYFVALQGMSYSIRLDQWRMRGKKIEKIRLYPNYYFMR